MSFLAFTSVGREDFVPQNSEGIVTKFCTYVLFTVDIEQREPKSPSHNEIVIQFSVIVSFCCNGDLLLLF